MLLLIIYGVLAVTPLLGIVWILRQGSITTVDGLFMSLILATISAIFGVSALFELREGGLRSAKLASSGRSSWSIGRRTPSTAAPNGLLFDKGRVLSVQFFESNIGEPNKSIVSLSNGDSRLLVVEGDVRNALPVGKSVEIMSREEAGHRILMDVHYI